MKVAFYDEVSGRVTSFAVCGKNQAGGAHVVVPDDMNIERPQDWIVSNGALVLSLPALTTQDVNAERDRRILDNFAFQDHPYDFDEISKNRIARSGVLAGVTWIDAKNEPVVLTAEECGLFAGAAAHHESAHILAAKALKDMAKIPDDYQGDAYWP